MDIQALQKKFNDWLDECIFKLEDDIHMSTHMRIIREARRDAYLFAKEKFNRIISEEEKDKAKLEEYARMATP